MKKKIKDLTIDELVNFNCPKLCKDCFMANLQTRTRDMLCDIVGIHNVKELDQEIEVIEDEKNN